MYHFGDYLREKDVNLCCQYFFLGVFDREHNFESLVSKFTKDLNRNTENIDVDTSQYAGDYSGTYSGDDSGTWTANLTDDGDITGLLEGDPFTGEVAEDGTFTGTTGGTTPTTLEGTIDDVGDVAGTWTNVAGEVGGTFAGSLIL